MANRETFGSNKVAILAMAGSAIGLGNIWRFPYMVGQNGGAAFIIIYIISCFLLAVPILMSETIIGHRTHQNTFGAMKTLAPGTKWSLLGLLAVVSPFIIMSYYSVVGGWSIDFLYKSVFEGFKIADGQLQGTSFGSFISSTWGPIICHTIFSLLCVVIVSAGVKSGIEKFNKICMPVLFILIIFILIFSVSLPGASAGIDYMLKPDFSKITGPIVASAVGQSFFSLSLGVGTILIYSSYIKSKENILNSGIGTTAFDLMFALLAGFAVMPAVFAAGIEP
ncbi:MAG: sodium-dependent transporter, partial [Bacteroidales bacterium]|nr:sodium-dependent transporter [Bacteroidales bacterium]